MAQTKKPIEGIEFAKRFIKEMPLEDVATEIVNDIHGRIWMAAPWSWSLGLIAPITVVNNTASYSFSLPADYFGPERAYLTSSDSKEAPRIILPVAIVPSDSAGFVGVPNTFSITGTPGSTGTLTLLPKPSGLGTTMKIYLVYKKVATQYTPTTIHTTALQLENEYFHVFNDGVLWRAYQYADDARAGGSTVAEGRVQHNGQRGQFESSLLQMQQIEERILIDPRERFDVK